MLVAESNKMFDDYFGNELGEELTIDMGELLDILEEKEPVLVQVEFFRSKISDLDRNDLFLRSVICN